MDYNEEFETKPLDFFKKYPVLPPSDAGQSLRNLTEIVSKRELAGRTDGTSIETITHGSPAPDDLIRWIDFKPSTSLNEPGALTFNASKEPPKGKGAVPVYFLPWRSMHLVSMSLPELGARDYDMPSQRNPKLFFTAAINGCSVFVKGKPTSPEIVHAGIDGKFHEDAVAFWQDCYARTDNVQRNGGIQREVNKTHYTKDAGFDGRARTRMAHDYMNWLESQHKDKLTITEVNPWGCVFGIRFGRLWSFYLQENSTVTTLEFVKKKELVDPKATHLKTHDNARVSVQDLRKKFMGIGYKTKVYAATRTSSKILRVSEFYPGGPGRYVSNPLFTKM